MKTLDVYNAPFYSRFFELGFDFVRDVDKIKRCRGFEFDEMIDDFHC
jgi:hypothetical protein